MADNKYENKAGLSFALRRGRLLVHHATIRTLGDPDYIRFLLNKNGKRIAIQCCEVIDGDNFRVPKDIEGTKYSFEISSSTFISVIYSTCGWDIDKTYMVYGSYYPKHRLVEFDLREAREIRPDMFVDPENM